MPEITTAVRVTFIKEDGERFERLCATLPRSGEIVHLDERSFVASEAHWHEQERSQILYPIIKLRFGI